MAAFTASRGHGALDHGVMSAALIVDTIPGFWLALILMLVFTPQLGMFPATGPLDPTNPGAFLLRLVLPVAVLAIGQVASVARITRTSCSRCCTRTTSEQLARSEPRNGVCSSGTPSRTRRCPS